MKNITRFFLWCFFSFGIIHANPLLLEDFTPPIRLNGDGDTLFNVYLGEDPGQNYNFDNDMMTVTTASSPTSAGVYMQFFPRNGGYLWGNNTYAQNWVQGGTFNDSINRMTFIVRVDRTVARREDGGDRMQLGTYIRDTNDTDPARQGVHYYHLFNPNWTANRWMKVVINVKPQRQVGTSVEPRPNPLDTGASPTKYFSGLTRWYWDSQGTGIWNGSVWNFDDIYFDYNTFNEPDSLVSSIIVYYTGTRYEISWESLRNVTVNYDIRYKTTSMHASTFESGTDGGSTSSTGSGYTGVHWASPNMAESPTGMYIAIRPAGFSTFTEVYVPYQMAPGNTGEQTAVAPVITSNPQNDTVTVPAPGSFSCAASGNPSPTYQWQKNGANVVGGVGGTSANYTTPATTTSDSGASYRCIATNSEGSDTSTAAVLSVLSSGPPKITTEPTNQVVTAPSAATFSVVADGTPLYYQWQKNGVDILNATDASYNTGATSLSDNGSTFRVIVTDSIMYDTSVTVTLTVLSAASTKVMVAPGDFRVLGNSYHPVLSATRLAVLDAANRLNVNDTLSTNGFLYASNSGALASTIQPGNGQLLIGRAGMPPVLGTIGGTTNEIEISMGPGTLQVGIPNSFTLPSASPEFTSVTVAGNPTAPLELTTKQYVDSVASGGGGSVGDSTGTGPLVRQSGATLINPTWSGTLTSPYTANRILITNGSSQVVTHTGALITNAFLYGGGPASFGMTGAATDGQILIGRTGLAPIAATISGTANQTSVTNGPGSITIGLADPLTLPASTFANPSASIGLTAVNGSASTIMRSDAAPAISQAIEPTWVGRHIFDNDIMIPSNDTIYLGSTTDRGQIFWYDNTEVERLVIASNESDIIIDPGPGGGAIFSTTGTIIADKLTLGGGFEKHLNTFTSSVSLSSGNGVVLADASSDPMTFTLPPANTCQGLILTILKVDSTRNTVTIDGDGAEPVGGASSIVLRGNSGRGRAEIISDGSGWKILDYYDEGTIVLTLHGVSGTVTGTGGYVLNTSMATISIPALSGTSTSTSMYIEGIPGHVDPTGGSAYFAAEGIIDDGNTYSGVGRVTTSSTILFEFRNSLTGTTSTFTASGTKGINALNVTYRRQVP